MHTLHTNTPATAHCNQHSSVTAPQQSTRAAQQSASARECSKVQQTLECNRCAADVQQSAAECSRVQQSAAECNRVQRSRVQVQQSAVQQSAA
eukprot:15433886-Alexandrium_andersonii.AAC.1